MSPAGFSWRLKPENVQHRAATDSRRTAMNKTTWTKWGWALGAGMVLAFAAQWALAQGGTNPNAGGKITGERYWPARAATRHIEAARGYAQEFQRYVTAVPQPEPSVVKDIKTELGRYLAEAQK